MVIGEWQILLRLALAVICGGIVGLEREAHGRPAGLRTHILVCIGSALIMIISTYSFINIAENSEWTSFDPGRIAAQVVSGIGFLGAGTILREGSSVRGLTTAASLWVVAGIGLAIGSGFFFGAVVTTIFVVFALKVLSRIELKFLHSKQHILTITTTDKPGQLAKIAATLGKYSLDIRSVTVEPEDELVSNLEIAIESKGDTDKLKLLEALSDLEGVINVNYSE